MLATLLRLLGAVVFACAVLLTVLLAWPLPEPPNVGIAGDYLITDVTIIDVDKGMARSGQDVRVLKGTIASIEASIEPTSSIPLTEGVQLVDGSGKYLLPGLWDMHTHSTKLAPHYAHPLQVANGVTGVRDMWGCMSEADSFFACIDDRKRWNDALDDGTGLSPRYVSQSSFQINGGNEVPEGYPEFFRARNEEHARELASFYAAAGADFLKPYSELSERVYLALAREARQAGLTLQGHRPLRVSLDTMLAARQTSVEHARLFLFECHPDAEAFRALPDPSAAYTPAMRARLVDEHDEPRCTELMKRMAASDTWWTPTLQTMRMSAMAKDPVFRADPRLKYVPYLYQRLMWMPDADRKATEIDEQGRNVYAAMYELAKRNVNEARQLGVKLLTGTDSFDSYVFPGFSTHDELKELVAAGLSPAQALRTATLAPAEFVGAEDRFGTVSVGRSGDLLLLDANPLEDIGNSRSIAGLFLAGRFFDRQALDELLAFAEQRAGSLHQNVHVFWRAISSPLLRVQFAD